MHILGKFSDSNSNPLLYMIRNIMESALHMEIVKLVHV